MDEARSGPVWGCTALSGRFGPRRNRRIRKTSLVALFFSSRGVPAPRILRRIKLRLNAPTWIMLTFEDVLSSAQMAAPQAARFVAMGEAALHPQIVLPLSMLPPAHRHTR